MSYVVLKGVGPILAFGSYRYEWPFVCQLCANAEMALNWCQIYYRCVDTFEFVPIESYLLGPVLFVNSSQTSHFGLTNLLYLDVRFIRYQSKAGM